MATQAQVDALKARLAEIQRRIEFEQSLVNTARANLQAAEAEADRLNDAAARSNFTLPAQQAQYDAALAAAAAADTREGTARTRLANETRDLGSAQSQLRTVQRQLAEAETALQPPAEKTPSATAGQEAAAAAPAGPNAAPAQTVAPDDQATTATNPETGTNAPVKTTAETQSIAADSNNGQPVPANPAAGTPSPTIDAGAASASDDGTPSGTPQTAVNAEEQTGPNVKPRPNVLDEYASYSYSASVYLMTEVQYARLLQSTTKKIDGYQLLFQSGGAPVNNGGIREPSPGGGPGASNLPDYVEQDGGRNPFFDNDFYIDSISIENLPPGKSTGSAHNISGLKFTLIEPNGITLLDRLYDAVANLAPTDGSGKVNYTAPTYLMVIRFYSYDEYGVPQAVKSKPDQEGTSDPAALIEKFIPFKVRSINWGVGSKLVSYEWDCVPTGQMIAGYTNRGTIPADVQLTNTTVGGLLGGDVTYSTASADATAPGAATTATPPSTDARQRRSQVRLAASQASAALPAAPSKADAAPTNKKTITGGLIGAMNEFQAKLVKDGVFTVADEYVIEFVGPDANKIRDAKLQLPNTKVDKRMTAAGQAPTQDAQALDQSKQSVDMISRSFSITAGQQLLQAIDLTIRNSSYISDQALVIVNPDGTTQPNPNSRNKPLKWFTIGMSAVPIGNKIDPKRNDYAYRITYTVAAREVKNVISKYFPVSKFTGVHKRYPYWFTGENTAVLEYQETLNAMYQLTVSGGENEKSAASKTREAYTSSMADIVTYNYAPTSTESNKGADGKSLEAAANAAEVLYSPGDLRECKIKIVGDPAWIMQGSTFRVLNEEMLGGQALTTGFLSDGSIAFDNQDVLFEIVWQRPEDYDLNTGLADPYSQTQKKYNNRTALQSRVYLCKKVVSDFRHGAFTQTLEGALYLFPVPSKTNTANPAAANNATSKANPNDTNDGSADRAEAAKLARQGQSGSTAGAGQGTKQFTDNDPRRLDIGDGGKAAILGAQSNAKSAPPPGRNTPNTPPGGAGNPSPGTLGSGTFQILPAGPAQPATSDTGQAVGVSGTTIPKIGENTNPTSPTRPQNQSMVKVT
jgi:chemotaxis protein histidine kinase CheA